MSDPTKFTELHWHELCDRLDVFSNMFEIAIVEHITIDDPETGERVKAIVQQIEELSVWLEENRR